MEFPFTRLQTYLVCCCVGLLTLGTPAKLAHGQKNPATEPTVAESFVEQLGFPDPEDRVYARKQLLQIGIDALPAVKAGLESADLEVRLQCQRLAVEIATAEHWRPVNEFAADVDGKLGKRLPGWKSFRENFGTEHEDTARKWFTQMYRSHRDFTEATAAGHVSADALHKFVSKANLKELDDEQRMVIACIALLGLAQLDAAVNQDQDYLNDVSGVCQRIAFLWPPDNISKIYKEDEHLLPGVQNLAGAWMVRQHTNNESLQFAYQKRLPAALEVARELLKGKSPTYLYMAIRILGRDGNAEDALLLEPLLDDSAFAKVATIRDRELALFTAIGLHGRKPTEFGFYEKIVDASGKSRLPTREENFQRTRERWKLHLEAKAAESTIPPPPQPTVKTGDELASPDS